MRLTSGSTLGSYEVLAPIGAGGMGEVYRARDQRLGRIVAIKVIAERFSDRVRREARAISALNHSNICQLYDICTEGDVDFLVMEYVEGETLADRIGRGRLDYKHAIEIGTQIAEALDAAHSRGVIHGDLKPANVMLTASGVKLIDFGLAKLQPAVAGAGGNELTVTLRNPVTEPGTIFGTVPYMAPEQLEGKSADERTDIFALGVVPYEMITGERPFSGSTPASLIASIMGAQPRTICSIQPLAPASVDRVVQTCLAKDPDKRWRRAFDVSIALHLPQHEPTTPLHRSAWPLPTAAAAAITAGALIWLLAHAPAAPEAAALSITPPEGARFMLGDSVGGSAISPDGRTLAFVSESGGRPMLWLRSLASPTATVVGGTEDGCCPFWAPDSRSIGFFSRGKLKKVRTTGVPPEVICRVESPRGGTWNANGDILFVPGPGQAGRINRVSENGGPVTVLTSFDRTRQEEAHYQPYFLPDGRRFLFWVRSVIRANTGLYISSLDKPSEKTWVADATSGAMFQPAYDGFPAYLIWVRGRTLVGQRFDSRSGALRGQPQTIAEDVGSFEAIGLGNFSVSATGALVYGRQGVDKLRLMRVDANGKRIATIAEPGAYFEPRFSPDGKHLAVRITSAEASHIWSFDLANNRKSRITFGALTALYPVWSPDGKGIAFTTTKAGMRVIAVKMFESSGEEVQITSGNAPQYATSWSPDGRFIAFNQIDSRTGHDLYVVPVNPGAVPVELLRTPANESNAQFSPDGSWVAYESDETGRREIYVQRFTVVNGRPSVSAKSQVSTSGGEHPRWSHDGRRLYFIGNDSMLTSMPVQTTSRSFSVGSPRALFKVSTIVVGRGTTYDVAPDDRSFIVVTEAEEVTESPLSILLHWPAKLAQVPR